MTKIDISVLEDKLKYLAETFCNQEHQEYENVQVYRHSLGFRNRHLVILIDGTWQDPIDTSIDILPTNIHQLSLHISPNNQVDEKQIKFYQPGIGTGQNSDSPLGELFNGLFPNYYKEIYRAYMSIVYNYQSNSSDQFDDKIYLFGFSRGAVTAYLVAELISNYGVLKPEHISDFSIIWEHFISGGKRAINKIDYNNFAHSGSNIIEFLGLFDAVPGSMRSKNKLDKDLKKLFNKRYSLNGNHYLVDMPSKVKTAVHILSIDEQRSAFAPMLMQIKPCSDASVKNLEQILLPGVHSDIGGGYKDNFFSNLALITMLSRIRNYTYLGLNFNKSCDLVHRLLQDWDSDILKINDEQPLFSDRLFNKLYSSWNGISNERKFDDKNIYSNDMSIYRHPYLENYVNKRVYYKSSNKPFIRNYDKLKRFEIIREKLLDKLFESNRQGA